MKEKKVKARIDRHVVLPTETWERILTLATQSGRTSSEQCEAMLNFYFTMELVCEREFDPTEGPVSWVKQALGEH